MQKLLIVCGPTGTGKTNLALTLAKKFNGEIVSADSRQVYKELNIGTGKDLPQGIKIWGYDLVDPKQKFSVSEYENIINNVIEDISNRNKLPILTGGTGLYIKSIVDGIGTASIAPNLNLRATLEGKTPPELFDILAQFDSLKAASMNQSDRVNPRRLVRAIEVAESGVKITQRNKPKYDSLFIGLTRPQELVKNQIEKRVQERFKQGIVEEIKNLLKDGVTWDDQSMSSMGYKEWKDYFADTKEVKEVLKEWVQNEIAYVKRQMVWFKKDKRIFWFDVSGLNYQEKLEKMVKKWYAS
ncbi:MAG: tRNA (adenosine(37)-N6)-dimethylallyltransferase MiaA [Patescibacteria group bacterium]